MKFIKNLVAKKVLNEAQDYVGQYYGMKTKKKFKDTVTGKILGGALGLINPTLGGVFNGTATISDVITNIKASDATPEDKVRAQEYVLKAYEAEVDDRIAARNREAMVASAGGSDILFKTIGWGVLAAFLGMVTGALGFWDIPEANQRMFDMAFGAVTTAMMSVVSYFFGSSLGSAQKNHLLKASEAEL